MKEEGREREGVDAFNEIDQSIRWNRISLGWRIVETIFQRNDSLSRRFYTRAYRFENR